MFDLRYNIFNMFKNKYNKFHAMHADCVPVGASFKPESGNAEGEVRELMIAPEWFMLPWPEIESIISHRVACAPSCTMGKGSDSLDSITPAMARSCANQKPS